MSLRDDPDDGQTYWLPYAQMNGNAFGMTAYVKTQQDPQEIAGTVRRLLRDLDPNVPLYNMVTFSQQMDQSLALERLVARLASGFGLLATLLAAIAFTECWRSTWASAPARSACASPSARRRPTWHGWFCATCYCWWA